MAMTLAELATEALSLPTEARTLLVEQLVQSLGDDPSDKRLDQLWTTEALRRLDEVRSGRVETVSGEEAARRVRCAVSR